MVSPPEGPRCWLLTTSARRTRRQRLQRRPNELPGRTAAWSCGRRSRHLPARQPQSPCPDRASRSRNRECRDSTAAPARRPQRVAPAPADRCWIGAFSCSQALLTPERRDVAPALRNSEYTRASHGTNQTLPLFRPAPAAAGASHAAFGRDPAPWFARQGTGEPERPSPCGRVQQGRIDRTPGGALRLRLPKGAAGVVKWPPPAPAPPLS